MRGCWKNGNGYGASQIWGGYGFCWVRVDFFLLDRGPFARVEYLLSGKSKSNWTQNRDKSHAGNMNANLPLQNLKLLFFEVEAP